jgi:hypothetical protein
MGFKGFEPDILGMTDTGAQHTPPEPQLRPQYTKNHDTM